LLVTPLHHPKPFALKASRAMLRAALILAITLSAALAAAVETCPKNAPPGSCSPPSLADRPRGGEAEDEGTSLAQLRPVRSHIVQGTDVCDQHSECGPKAGAPVSTRPTPGKTSPYQRPPNATEESLAHLLLDAQDDYEQVISAQRKMKPASCDKPPCSSQVHIQLGGENEIVVSFASKLPLSDCHAQVVFWEKGHAVRKRTATGMAETYSSLNYITGDWMWGDAPMPSPFHPDKEAIAEQMSTYDWAYYGNDPSRHVPHIWKNITVEDVAKITYPGEFGDYWNPGNYYFSPRIHTVVLHGLKPDTHYEYMVANNHKVFQFKTPKGEARLVCKRYPFRVGLFSDLGQTAVSAFSMQQMLKWSPEVALLSGDLSYADGYGIRWDSFGNLFQPLAARVPIMYSPGNHEFAYGESFVPYSKRYPMPYRQSGSTNAMYWSRKIGPMHVISLNTYDSTARGSDQYSWLKGDLESVDRTSTPWVIVMMHAPFYSSNAAHLMEAKVMRTNMEDLLYEHSVNIVLSGHVHSYERTHPTFANETCACGPVYLNLGDAGNREGPSNTWLGGNDGAAQPAWSAFRQSSFGIGKLTLQCSEWATFTWIRNSCYTNGKPDFNAANCVTDGDDSSDASDPNDFIWIERQPKCEQASTRTCKFA